MKPVTLFFVCILCLCSSVFATNRHFPQQAGNQSVRGVMWDDECEVEILNHSFMDIRVSGVYDDGSVLYPFNVYSFEPAHYITLYFNGYCHDGIDLDIDTLQGVHIYGNYARRGATVRIGSNYMRQATVNGHH